MRLGLLVFGLLMVVLGSLWPKASVSTQIKSEPLQAAVSTFAAEPVTIAANLYQLRPVTNFQPLPKRIVIPTLNLDLAVKTARVVKGYWEVFPDSAGYGDGSGIPGTVGNQVIFAHARKNLFIDLPRIKIGDTVYVFTDKSWFHYKVKEKKEVHPSEKEIIAQTPDETLTLYTCSGFADSKRFIIIAKRV
ncbi:sortase [Candidatus Curtissbacteria bacterium]|nr:sortase [Candidatus Curtissbacteria bacterium]